MLCRFSVSTTRSSVPWVRYFVPAVSVPPTTICHRFGEGDGKSRNRVGPSRVEPVERHRTLLSSSHHLYDEKEPSRATSSPHSEIKSFLIRLEGTLKEADSLCLEDKERVDFLLPRLAHLLLNKRSFRTPIDTSLSTQAEKLLLSWRNFFSTLLVKGENERLPGRDLILYLFDIVAAGIPRAAGEERSPWNKVSSLFISLLHGGVERRTEELVPVLTPEEIGRRYCSSSNDRKQFKEQVEGTKQAQRMALHYWWAAQPAEISLAPPVQPALNKEVKKSDNRRGPEGERPTLDYRAWVTDCTTSLSKALTESNTLLMVCTTTLKPELLSGYRKAKAYYDSEEKSLFHYAWKKYQRSKHEVNFKVAVLFFVMETNFPEAQRRDGDFVEWLGNPNDFFRTKGEKRLSMSFSYQLLFCEAIFSYLLKRRMDFRYIANCFAVFPHPERILKSLCLIAEANSPDDTLRLLEALLSHEQCPTNCFEPMLLKFLDCMEHRLKPYEEDQSDSLPEREVQLLCNLWAPRAVEYLSAENVGTLEGKRKVLHFTMCAVGWMADLVAPFIWVERGDLVKTDPTFLRHRMEEDCASHRKGRPPQRTSVSRLVGENDWSSLAKLTASVLHCLREPIHCDDGVERSEMFGAFLKSTAAYTHLVNADLCRHIHITVQVLVDWAHCEGRLSPTVVLEVLQFWSTSRSDSLISATMIYSLIRFALQRLEEPQLSVTIANLGLQCMVRSEGSYLVRVYEIQRCVALFASCGIVLKDPQFYSTLFDGMFYHHANPNSIVFRSPFATVHFWRLAWEEHYQTPRCQFTLCRALTALHRWREAIPVLPQKEIEKVRRRWFSGQKTEVAALHYLLFLASLDGSGCSAKSAVEIQEELSLLASFSLRESFQEVWLYWRNTATSPCLEMSTASQEEEIQFLFTEYAEPTTPFLYFRRMMLLHPNLTQSVSEPQGAGFDRQVSTAYLSAVSSMAHY